MGPAQFCARQSRALNQSDRIAGAGRQQGGRDYSRAAMCSRCEPAEVGERGGCEAIEIKKDPWSFWTKGLNYALFCFMFREKIKIEFSRK